MNAHAALTKRESQIAELIAWGATKKDVANKLFISERTVENTARSIYEKAGVTKSNELSAWWFCTKFHISFELSPLKKSVIAVFLLLIIVSHELVSKREDFTRVRRVESRARSRKRTESEKTFELS